MHEQSQRHVEIAMKLKLTKFIRRNAGARTTGTGSSSRRVALGALVLLVACTGTLILAPASSRAADAPVKIGIIGTGRMGSALARLWIQAGHPVMLSSRHPDQLKPLAQELGSLARVGTAQEAAKYGDVVLISVPFEAVADIAREVGKELSGKVVLDSSNPFPPGSDLQKATVAQGGTGVVNGKKLAGARLVRAFNTMGFNQLPKLAGRSGELIGIPIAGDDSRAVAVAEQLVRDAGFEPVLVGPLSSAKRFDFGGELPRGEQTASEIRHTLGLPAR